MNALLSLPPTVLWAGVVWVVVMVAVPLLTLRRREALGISLGVAAQVLVVLAVLVHNYGGFRTAAVALTVGVCGWVAEFIGSRTGFPFGSYHYTTRLRPQIGRVPIIIPLAWLMMLPTAWAVAQLLVGDYGRLATAVVAAAAFTAWDLYLDPQMVRWDFWRWPNGGWYYGVPAVNYLGWFIWSLAISFLGQQIVPWEDLLIAPLIALYTLMWAFEFGGQMFFWRLRKAAVVGGVTMGLFALAAVARFSGLGF